MVLLARALSTSFDATRTPASVTAQESRGIRYTGPPGVMNIAGTANIAASIRQLPIIEGSDPAGCDRSWPASQRRRRSRRS